MKPQATNAREKLAIGEACHQKFGQEEFNVEDLKQVVKEQFPNLFPKMASAEGRDPKGFKNNPNSRFSAVIRHLKSQNRVNHVSGKTYAFNRPYIKPTNAPLKPWENAPEPNYPWATPPGPVDVVKNDGEPVQYELFKYNDHYIDALEYLKMASDAINVAIAEISAAKARADKDKAVLKELASYNK